MSRPQFKLEEQPALLVLGDGAKLAGDCNLIGELQFQLARVKLLAGTSSSGRVRLHQGMQAELTLTRQQNLPSLPVTIQNIVEGRLELHSSQPDSEIADTWRELLMQRPLPPVRPSSLSTSSVEYTRLLRDFHQKALQQFEALLPGAIDAIHDDLQVLSQRIKSASQGKNNVFNAAVGIGGNREAISEMMLDHIQQYFQVLTPGSGDDEFWQEEIDKPEELDLVDLDEFEGHLAFNRTVALAEELYRVELEALTIRLARLIDADPLKVRLPIHARQLCRAFQLAIEPVEIAPEAAPVVYEYFSQHLIRPLARYYADLNQVLADAHIEPDLETRIRAKGSLLKRGQRPTHKPAADEPAKPEPPQPEPPAAVPAASGEPAPSGFAARLGAGIRNFNIYKSVVDALNFHREARGLARGEDIASGIPLSGTWEGGTVPTEDVDQTRLADANTIAAALLSLQHSQGSRQALHDAESVREFLAAHREEISALRNSSGLTLESLNQLDMVDNLFDTIRSHIDLAEELQPSLSNLKIPLTRLALLDPRFFVEAQHPARAVVDRLANLASSANFPNRALEMRINRIVDQVADNYEQDESVFAQALEEIDKLSEQQERALSRNVERVVRIQEGQEKVQQARVAVSTAINDRIRPPAAPRVLLDLVESGWRDLLVLTHVRDGPESSAWAEHLKTLDQLGSWLEVRQSCDNDEDVLMQRSLEAETLIELVEQQLSAALPTNVQYQPVLAELRGILSGSRDVIATAISEEDRAEADAPRRLRARVEELPRLRRWVKRVEQMKRDTWLTYLGDDRKKRRMQLAWISADRDRFIFVNERGQKVADLSAVQLARKLSQGVKPPAPTDHLPVVDKSMYHTLEHVQETLSFSRNHDSLTRLINRDTFLNQIDRALRHARVKNAQHAVLYLDIDNFALVNEVFDRINGDHVLAEFSRLLAQLHGKKASSARIEGDQFAVLLLDRDLDAAAEYAEKIRTDIENSSVDIEGEQVTFTVSIGVAPVLEYSPSVDDVLDSARQAMRRAKESGRNQVQRFVADQALATDFRKDRSRTRSDLEQALATDRFVLRAQPIVQVAVNGQQPVGRHYELLLGLTNPDGSISSPEEFIQSAERYGFMNLVDRWVVREAFSWVSKLMDAQKEVPFLAINLSGSSVTDDQFLEYLLEQISEFGVGTSRICFEITETGTITNLIKAADFVRAFRNIGCKFSIDDFGTGLASHNYLRELPVDYVKIDGTFITGIHLNRADYAMARSINDLAHFLGQETIAESVENDEIIVKLEEIGVDYLQGWGVAMPRPLPEIAEELSSIVK
ncbi:DUF1631 family protein [Haliea sp. E17]|uniref:DUF1631 family protein n=1 Tax=Haliea sp. E17 TaxID=3401576 RepID=UPI003AAA539B